MNSRAVPFAWRKDTCPGILHRPRILAAACAIGICALGAPARAQDVAAAKTMFDGGLAEMEAGHFNKGCPALEASYKLDPRPGTLFTLAECEAKWGHLATAAARYDDYLSMYARLTPEQQRKQADRPKIAQAQKAALGPQVPQLTLLLPPDAPKETTVRRDGTELTAAMLGVALPVDPGEHRVTTQVPGGEVAELRVTISKGDKKQVTLQVKAASPVAALKPDGAPEALSPDVEVPAKRRNPVPAIAMGVGALAAAGAGVGLIVAANGRQRDALALDKEIGQGGCYVSPPDVRCATLYSMARSVDTFRYVSVGTFIGAGVLAAGAVTYLLWPAPKPAAKKTGLDVHAAPGVGAHDGVMMIWGSF